jgi:AAA domain
MNPVTIPEPIWDSDFPTSRLIGPDWLLHGFIARGSATLLTSQWEAGKTTLLSMLLPRRAVGGALRRTGGHARQHRVISEQLSVRNLSKATRQMGPSAFG